MTKTLIYTDTQKAAQVADAWQTQKENLQAGVIDLYKATGLPALAPGELHRLFNDTTDFLFDKLTNNEPAHLAIGGGDNKTYLPINKAAAIGIMQKPAGYEALLEGIRSITISAPKGVGLDVTSITARYETKSISRCFDIDADGNLSFTENTWDIINEAGKLYISSKAGNKIYSFVEAAVKAYYDNGMDEVYKTHRKEMPEIFMEVIEHMDNKNKTFIPNKDFLQVDKHLMAQEHI